MILLIWGPQWKSVGTTGYHSAHGVVDFTSNPIIINTWDGISQGELITRSILVMGVASAGQLCWPGKKSMRAKYFQLVSIEPQGGKACCSQLGESSNHSGLRLAIRFVALSFFFFFFELLLGRSMDAQWAKSHYYFEIFSSLHPFRNSHPASALHWFSIFLFNNTLMKPLVQVHVVF